MLPIRTLLIVLPLLSIAPAPRAAQPVATADAGITGFVLTPDGSPVTRGNVTLMTSVTHGASAAIDRTGHFRILPDGQGRRRLYISVPGLAPYLANVTVPSSRKMALPDLTLQEATYFRARFVTAEGEPLPGALRRRAVDGDGFTIPDPLDHVREHFEPDGSITIGPLPAGRILMAFDRPPLAQTRLRDIDVNGSKLIEGGTIAIAPGAQLNVDIVDGAEKPVPRHDVWLEDAMLPSPLSFQPVRTNEQGRAVFDRLASGRYRVWTRTVDRCEGRVELVVSRLVTVGGSGAARTRLVVGGRATLKITTVLGALYGRGVTLSPEAPAMSPWRARIADSIPLPRRVPMAFGSASSCGGVTDADGRVTLAPFPPGPSQLRVSLFNSTYIARVTVPENGGEIAIGIPDGLTPVHVTNHITRQPVAAQVVWVGGGGRVEAAATPNGDVLLEGVGRIGGTLTIRAREYQTLEGRFDETPETQQDVALMPAPSARVPVRIVDSDGAVIAGAVVELLSRGAGDAAELVAADAKGIATFLDVREGALQFGAHAEGFASAVVRVPEESRSSIVVTLKRAQ